MHRSPAATCRSVTKIYQGAVGDTRALDGVDADIASGVLTALMGPSGSGKSTLLRILAGLDRPTSGSVEVGDRWLSEMSRRARRRLRRRTIGFVFQKPSDNLISYLTASQHLHLAAGIKGAGRSEVSEIAHSLGIEGRLGNRPDQLSGGEQQRLAFAQAAIGGPHLIVADEPTAELDHESAGAMLALLRSLAEKGSSIVIATHDDEVAAVADHIVRLDEGRVVVR